MLFIPFTDLENLREGRERKIIDVLIDREVNIVLQYEQYCVS